MKSSKKGFALVEAIVVSAVLFVLTAGLITAAIISMQITTKNIDQRQAYLNAKSALSFAETYYQKQLQLPENVEYISFGTQDGTVGDSAVFSRKDMAGNPAAIPDAETYIKAEYSMDTQSFKLTASARYIAANMDTAQNLTLSCNYDVGYDADGRITTVVKKIETKSKSRFVYIHVKQPFNESFQPYLYTWGYGTGQREQTPNAGTANTLFSGAWLTSNIMGENGEYLYAGPQGAMLRETGGSSGTGGWNGWYYDEIEITDENVKYINAIIARKGALRGDALTDKNKDAQSHEIFQLPIPDAPGETQDVYITLNNPSLRDVQNVSEFDACTSPDSLTDYLTSYIKADYTTVHVRVAKDTEGSLSAPVLSTTDTIIDKNLLTVLSDEGDKEKNKFTSAGMAYEGFGWYRVNVPTKDAFNFSITSNGTELFKTQSALSGGVNNEIWVALTSNNSYNSSAHTENTEEKINEYFRNDLKDDSAGKYATVNVKGLALTELENGLTPQVAMNYFTAHNTEIPLPPSSGQLKLTLKYNDEKGTEAVNTYEKNTKINLPVLTRDGYKFKGWSKSSATLKVDYAPGAEYTVKINNAYLYGVWEAIEYIVQYDANGGENPPPTQSFQGSGSVTAQEQGAMTRNGYAFTGWSKTPDGEAKIQPGDKITMTNIQPESKLTLYAVWNNKNKITYHANGGTGTVPASQEVVFGASVTLSSGTSLQKENCKLLGWSEDRTSATAQYAAGQTITPSKSMTLYAVWKKTTTTIYFINAKSELKDIYVYTWNSANTASYHKAWPGEKMTDTGETVENGYKLYSYELPADKGYNRLQFNGGSDQSKSPDVIFDDSKPLFSFKYSSNFDVMAVAYKFKTAYFINRNDSGFSWGSPKIYVWNNSDNNINNGGWPGRALKAEKTNASGELVYSYKYPAGKYTHAVFNNNNGNPQTVDIDISSDADNQGYRLGTQSGGKYTVTKSTVQLSALSSPAASFLDGVTRQPEFSAVNTQTRALSLNTGGSLNLWSRLLRGTSSGETPELSGADSLMGGLFRLFFAGDNKLIFNTGKTNLPSMNMAYSDESDAGVTEGQKINVYFGAPADWVNHQKEMVVNTFNGIYKDGVVNMTDTGKTFQYGGVSYQVYRGEITYGATTIEFATKDWNKKITQSNVSLSAYFPKKIFLPDKKLWQPYDTTASEPYSDKVYVTGEFNGWSVSNADYKMACTDDGAYNRFEVTANLEGGKTYKFKIFDYDTYNGKANAQFSGASSACYDIDKNGGEMALKTLGTSNDRIEVKFTYYRQYKSNAETKTNLIVTQGTAAAEKDIKIYIGVAGSIVSDKGDQWKTPEVLCKDKNGDTKTLKTTSQSSETTSLAPTSGAGEQAFYTSYVKIPSSFNNIRLRVSGLTLPDDYFNNVQNGHLYLLYYGSDKVYHLVDYGDYSPESDVIIDFNGEWTKKDVRLASAKGSKVQYYNTKMAKLKDENDKIVSLSSPATTYGNMDTRAGNSATCYLNDWYTYKIPTDGSYTLQFKGLNGKSAEINNGIRGEETVTVNSLRSSEVWITLNTNHTTSEGKLDDLSVYTYDPDENYAGKDTIIYLDDTAGWGGPEHDQPVYAFYWGVKTMAWPGKEMTYDEKINKYYVKVPSGSPNLIINNGFDMEDEESLHTDVLFLQGQENMVCFDNTKNEWTSYIHPRNKLLKAINSAIAALNRSTVQKTANSSEVTMSFTMLVEKIRVAQEVYKNYTFDEYELCEKDLTSYTVEIDAFAEVLKEARIYIKGYPENIYFDKTITYTPESLATLKDAHNTAVKVYEDSAVSASRIRNAATLMRKAIDDLELQLSTGGSDEGGDALAGQAVVVLVNNDKINWPVNGETGAGKVRSAAYNEGDPSIPEIGDSQNLTQYNSQGYYLHFVNIPAGKDTAWAKFYSNGSEQSPRKEGIKAGEIWIYDTAKGTWRQNSAGDFKVISAKTVAGDKGQSRTYSPKTKGKDFKLSFTYDTTVKYDGAQYVIYAGVYEIKAKDFADGINLFSSAAKTFFTNPLNFGMTVENTKWSYSDELGWTDESGKLTGIDAGKSPGTVNFLIGGQLNTAGSGADPVTPSKRVYFYDNKDGKWSSAGNVYLNLYGITVPFPNGPMLKSNVSGYYYCDLPANIDLTDAQFGFHTQGNNQEISSETGIRKASSYMDVNSAQVILFTLESGRDEKNYEGKWTKFDTSVNPGFDLDKPAADTSGNPETGTDLDAAGQHNKIMDYTTSFPTRDINYTAGGINFRWVTGNILDVTGSNVSLLSQTTTFACSDIAIMKTPGNALSGGLFVGSPSALNFSNTVIFYTDVNVIVYNSDSTVDKDSSFTIKNGKYKLRGKVNLFDFKTELEKTGGDSKVISVDSGKLSGGEFGHD